MVRWGSDFSAGPFKAAEHAVEDEVFHRHVDGEQSPNADKAQRVMPKHVPKEQATQTEEAHAAV